MSARDVVCIGEALVDFLPDGSGKRVRDVERWSRCSGGSPANVATGVARLGGRSALVGVVGEDEFGHFLKEQLEREGVDVSRVRLTSDGKTGLAFVSLGPGGERSFSFHRTRSAESFLGRPDVDLPFVRESRVVHCGTNSLGTPEAQAAVLEMLGWASAGGRIVSCDPNLRLHMWPDPTRLKQLIAQIVPLCSVLKLSMEETEFVTGHHQAESALKALAAGGVLLPIVTAGPDGAAVLWGGEVVRVPAPQAEAVDTTGAGDGFTAGMLHGLSRLFATRAELERAKLDVIEQLARFACAVGTRVVEQMGAVAGLPRREELGAVLPPCIAC